MQRCSERRLPVQSGGHSVGSSHQGWSVVESEKCGIQEPDERSEHLAGECQQRRQHWSSHRR